MATSHPYILLLIIEGNQTSSPELSQVVYPQFDLCTDPKGTRETGLKMDVSVLESAQ